jgi:uncharacterized membrane protein HdeD (DUF308 family)
MERFRRREVWSMRLGIALILLGTVALGTLRAADSTGASPMLFGWLLVVSGLMEAVHAFHKSSWGGFLLHLMPCVAGVPIGLLIATHPSPGGTAWMLLFASYFTVVGLFRTISAFWFKFPAWMGGVRRNRFTPPRRGLLDEFTSAGAMGLWLLRRHFNDSTRLVFNHVCAGSCPPA